MSKFSGRNRVRIGQISVSARSADVADRIRRERGVSIASLAGQALDALLEDMEPKCYFQQMAAAQKAVRDIADRIKEHALKP